MTVPAYLRQVNRIKYILAVGVLLAINACKKESPHPAGSSQSTANIYVGGSVLLPSGAWQGAYFKNSINNTVTAANARLDTVQNSNAVISMAVLDSTVYMAANTAGYWKGGTFIPVNGASAIQYLALNSNTIAMAGQDNAFNLTYWVNGSQTNVMNTFNRTVYPNQGFMVYGFSGMTLSGNEVMISGSYNFMDEPIPGATTADTSTLPGLYETLWVNGNIRILYHDYWNVDVDYTSTVGVVSSGNDIYVAAQMTSDSGTKNSGGYFRNGGWNIINNGAFRPNSIYASGTDVYISGYTYTFPPYSNFKAAYCKNGDLVPIDGTAAKAITTFGTDLYILAIDGNGNYVVWKNGAIIETLGSASTLNLSCIAIAN
jgi:hypothetical protein